MRAGVTKLILPNGRHLTRVMSVFVRLYATSSVAEFPIRARDDDCPHPLPGVVLEDATGRGRFVVGVSVHGHQRQLGRRSGGRQWSITSPYRRPLVRQIAGLTSAIVPQSRGMLSGGG